MSYRRIRIGYRASTPSRSNIDARSGTGLFSLPALCGVDGPVRGVTFSLLCLPQPCWRSAGTAGPLATTDVDDSGVCCAAERHFLAAVYCCQHGRYVERCLRLGPSVVGVE